MFTNVYTEATALAFIILLILSVIAVLVIWCWKTIKVHKTRKPSKPDAIKSDRPLSAKEEYKLNLKKHAEEFKKKIIAERAIMEAKKKGVKFDTTGNGKVDIVNEFGKL